MKDTTASARHFVLLDGSGAARAIAQALAGRDGWCVAAALPVRARNVGPLARFLQEQVFSAVIDATHPFAGPFAGRISARAARLCRRMDLPCARLLRLAWTPGRFSADQEAETLRRLKVDVLLGKDSGGAASRSKLDAARRLGLPAILFARPPRPDAIRLRGVAAAMAWVDKL